MPVGGWGKWGVSGKGLLQEYHTQKLVKVKTLRLSEVEYTVEMNLQGTTVTRNIGDELLLELKPSLAYDVANRMLLKSGWREVVKSPRRIEEKQQDRKHGNRTEACHLGSQNDSMTVQPFDTAS